MLRNILALIVGAILLILGFMFSLLVIAVIAALGLAIWGYLWWKTRKIRQAVHEQAPDGQIIEGEAIVVDECIAETANDLPADLREQPLPFLSSRKTS